jgi:hypothetical protein
MKSGLIGFTRHISFALLLPSAIACTCAQTAPGSAYGANLYVSLHGSDANPGTQQKPFATLSAAQSAVRKLKAKGLPAGGVAVWLAGGLYPLQKGLVLDQQDSGEATSPVVYRAMPGEPARLFGGTRLDTNAFRVVTDAHLLARMDPKARGHVVALPLKDGPEKFSAIFKGNGGLPRLIRNGATLQLSRWPNPGYTTMESVLESGITPPQGGTFRYRDEVAPHAERWAAEAKAGNLWLTGFWRVPFETESVQVKSVDTAAHTITLAVPVPNGIGSKYVVMVNGTRPGNGKEPYFAFNLLAEISQPGEWSYDFATHTIYLWPPSPIDAAKDEYLFADLNTPVVTLNGANHIVLEHLQFEGSVVQAVLLKDANNDLIAGSTIRNTGGGGIEVEGGSNDLIQSNDLVHIGTFGIRIVAGDRKTLMAANVTADNNHISHFGEQERITQAIYLGGVGNRASHNLIHDGPYHGIEYQGNDQQMVYNEIHHVGLDAGDLGAFYTNGDWAAQGNVIAYNFAHHSPNGNGSYIDDGGSGRTTVGNVFYKLGSGLFIGGGHNNITRNNLIVDCKVGIHLDDRGIARHYDTTAHHLVGTWKTIDANQPPWSTRYPNFMAGILADPTRPTGNVFENNALVETAIPYQLSDPALLDAKTNPVFATDPGFVDMASLNFSLKPGNAISKSLPGFKPIPFREIGLRTDQYRTTLPTDEQTGRNTDGRPAIDFDSNTDVKASDRLAKPQQ